jgi:cytochrome c556
MMRTVVVAGALLLGVGAVMAQQDIAVKQDNLMRAQGKSMYGVILKMTKGEIPYDQKAVDASYGSSQKVWQNKADFDSKTLPVAKAIADVKGKITDVASLKVAYDSINTKCTDCHETYRVKLK